MPIGKAVCHIGSCETGSLEGCKLVFRPQILIAIYMSANVFKNLFLQFLNKFEKRNIQRALILLYCSAFFDDP
jgi:hypothetical protein